MSYTIEYAKSLPAGKALLIIPGKPAVAEVKAEDGSVTTAARAEVPEKVLDVSSQIEGLYFLSLGKESKFPGERALPALKALGVVGHPAADKVFLAFNYKTKTHESAYVSTVAQACDKAACSFESFNDPAIVAAQAIIDAKRKEIASAHTVCDASLIANGKGTPASTPATPSLALQFLAELEAASA